MRDHRPTPGDRFNAPGSPTPLVIQTVHLGVHESTAPDWHIVTATNGERFAVWAVTCDDGVCWAGDHFDWIDRRAGQ